MIAKERKDFLKVRGMMIETVVTVSGETSLEEAIGILYNKHIGSVVIIDEDRKCEGIFTERDAIRVIATGIPVSTPLKDVMTKNPRTIRENATFAEAKRLMNTHHVRHLPVVDEQECVMGLLSLRQVLDELFNVHTVTG
jgi:CBS domain-containing protein